METWPLAYIQIPDQGLEIAASSVLQRGSGPLELSWFETKVWVEERELLLPTSRQWSKAQDYLRQENPRVELLMSTSGGEWTDSLIALPHPHTGVYAECLDPPLIPGKDPVLIEGCRVEKTASKKTAASYEYGGYIIRSGTRTVLSGFPSSWNVYKSFNDSFPPAPISELGLRSHYLWGLPFDGELHYDEKIEWSDEDRWHRDQRGLRAVIRGEIGTVVAWWGHPRRSYGAEIRPLRPGRSRLG